MLRHLQRLNQTAETAVQIHFQRTGQPHQRHHAGAHDHYRYFLPLNLITGIFGMNFRFMPLLKHSTGFWIAMSAMLLIKNA